MSSGLVSNKKSVLIDTFSFHSFLNSGFFYCWSLGDQYDIVLLVEQGNENSAALQVLKNTGKIVRIEVMPAWSRRWALFRWLGGTLPHLISELKPSLVLMNSWHSFHQKIISRFVREVCPDTPIAICSSVHIPITDFEVTAQHLVGARKSAWQKRWPWLPRILSDLAHDTWGRWVGIRDFKLLPLLFAGEAIQQSHCPWQGKLFLKDEGELYDAVLCYTEVERRGYAMEMLELEKIHFIRHPMNVLATQALFSTGQKGARIAVLPSSCLDYDDGDSIDQQIDALARLWGDALEIVQQQSDLPEIWWKLHPSFVDDPVMTTVTERLAERLSGFQSMTGKITAEAMIVESSVVVGDVSSALLWAMRLGQRRILSLDIFEMPIGDEMSHYPNIFVIDSLEKLKSLGRDFYSGEMKDDNRKPSNPSALEFFSSLRRS
ncbi:hypothetical protein [Thalassospira xiamenensis]|uniref:hypothetical protein n=1 Tax=Thalassospira xiamenensis TaxID=220697 RepID=UPI003AA8B6FC